MLDFPSMPPIHNPLISAASLGFLTLMASCTVSCAGRMTTDSAPTKSDPAVGKLMMLDGGTCTAWKIDNELIATAGHCCDDPEGYYLEGPHAIPGETLSVLVDDNEHDVCVMKGHMRGAPILLAARDPAIGDRIWTAGYPHGVYIISDGFWSGRHKDNWGMASNFVYFGASGSPLLNNAGESVGVVVMLMRGTDNIALISPLEYIRGALYKARMLLHPVPADPLMP